MQLKIFFHKDKKHSDTATCVGWSNSEELYSCGDDHQLLKWNTVNKEVNRVCELSTDLMPLDLHFAPHTVSTVGNKHSDLILITSADGKFYLFNRTGKLERSVDAHKGAILIGRWSYDGSGFMTAGEDGQLKIWSRNGMLRSTLVTCESSIYSAAWSPDNQAVLHTQGRLLSIRPLAPNTKPLKWKAHDGLILKVSWCPTNWLIVSGGEDCRYRVWDQLGRSLYISSVHDYPITSVAWSPAGDLFSVGAYNTLRLCDSSGWSHVLEKLQTGSIYHMEWSNDNTQVAAACANGQVMIASVFGRHNEWKQHTATVTGHKTIDIHDLKEENDDKLDFPDRIIHMSLAHDYLIVTTPNQCHIYSTNNWNTPVIFDLKEGAVCNILQCDKYLAIIEKYSVGIYNYQGRLIMSPRWNAMYPAELSKSCISLCADMFIVRDNADKKVVNVFEINSSKSNIDSGKQIPHSLVIAELSINKSGPAVDRQIAIIDMNRDLYLLGVRNIVQKQFNKLGSQIQAMCWHAEINMLAVLQDGRFTVWYCPAEAVHNIKLLRLTSLELYIPELGRNPVIVLFHDKSIQLRRTDGSLINILISPYVLSLYDHVIKNKWSDGLKLCRTIQEEFLWACLAALATHAKVLDIAEEAYAAIHQYDKVSYIQEINNLSNRAQKLAGAALLGGSVREAESILLHAGLVFHAIMCNIDMHFWTRALELALKHKTHIDTVLYLRKLYLTSINKEETNPKFLQMLNIVEIDDEKIKSKIEIEMKKQ